MKTILFTKKACTYCKDVMNDIVNKIEIETLDFLENLELANDLGVKYVPSLVIADDCGRANVYVGNDQIQQYLNN